MAICVSRRNRRKTRSQNTALKRDYILLFVSLAVFFGALTCFAWAVPSRSSPPDQQSSASSSASSSTQEYSYAGRIASGQNQSASSSSSANSSGIASASSNSSSSSTAHSQSSNAAPEPAIPPEETTASPASGNNDTQQGTYVSNTGAEYVEYYEEGESQSYYVIHHTAYQEYPVYTTVHHQASTPREVTVNGTTRIEWTNCPVCGQQHGSSYNERVVDHVNEVYCAACGGKHASAYDEVVYE